MRTKQSLGNALLLLAAMIWGFAFVAQSVAMDRVGPFTFTAVRSLLGSAALVPVIAVRNRKRKEPMASQERKMLLVGGLLCGLALCVAANLQQIGVSKTTVGKAGFITALYVVLVPVCGLFLKKKVPLTVWCSVAIAVAGLYFLCINDSLSVAPRDLYTLGCALVITAHIFIIDHFSPHVDGVQLSCLQFLVTGVLSLVPAFLLEQPAWGDLLAAWAPILYAGILSSGVAYTLQIVGQKFTTPALASLIMSLESVFAVLGGALVLYQLPTPREALGCGLMFAAILLSQVATMKKGETA